MQLMSLKHGGIESKNLDKKKVPKAWGYCMKKIGQKKPYLPFCMKEGGVGGFLALMLTKLVTLKSDKKLKVSEVRNCSAN
jgi:hypothetical protein